MLSAMKMEYQISIPWDEKLKDKKWQIVEFLIQEDSSVNQDDPLVHLEPAN